MMWNRVLIMTLNTPLVCAWERSKPALMFSWRLHVSGPTQATAYHAARVRSHLESWQ